MLESLLFLFLQRYTLTGGVEAMPLAQHQSAKSQVGPPRIQVLRIRTCHTSQAAQGIQSQGTQSHKDGVQQVPSQPVACFGMSVLAAQGGCEDEGLSRSPHQPVKSKCTALQPTTQRRSEEPMLKTCERVQLGSLSCFSSRSSCPS